MRHLLALAALTLFALSAQAQTSAVGNATVKGTATVPGAAAVIPTPTHVQSCLNFQDGVQFTVITVTCSAPVGAGHFFYLCTSTGNGNVSTPTPSGNSETFVNDPGGGTPFITFSYDGGGELNSCWYVLSSNGGATTYTITYSLPNTNVISVNLDEFTLPSGSFDVGENGVAGSGTVLASNTTPTTTGTKDLCVGLLTARGNSLAVTGSWIAGASGSASGLNGVFIIYNILSSNQTVQATGTQTSNPWAAHAACFKP